MCSNKYLWVGLGNSIVLVVLKGTVGLLSNSRALIMSAFYSIHDVIAAITIITGLKIANAPKDEEHPYGHGKVEDIISVFTSLLIMGGVIFLLIDIIRIVYAGEHSTPHWAVFGTALIAVFANEIIHRYNICAFKRLNSPAVLTGAKHHRADAISSLAVVIAVLGGKLGFHFLDSVVAIFEAGHLIILSGEILYHSSAELMDRSLDQKIISVIRRVVSGIVGEDTIKNIKTRQIGRLWWIDLSLALPDNITITEADNIKHEIEYTLKRDVKHLEHVNVIYE
ncbi:MAG: cation transporter [Planctomycetes bacterium]|nr:cation transporter [Planctomycetota bacterium]